MHFPSVALLTALSVSAMVPQRRDTLAASRSPKELPVAAHSCPLRIVHREAPAGRGKSREGKTAYIKDDEHPFGPDNGSRSKAFAIDRQVVYATNVTLGGDRTYSLIIDTGSADIWIPHKQFRCQATANSEPIPQSECQLGPLYDGPIKKVVKGQNLHIVYGPRTSGAPFVTGPLAYLDVEVAGVSIPQQIVGVPLTGIWRGDGVTSGVLGLGLPTLTSARTWDGRARNYDSLITSMRSRGEVVGSNDDDHVQTISNSTVGTSNPAQLSTRDGGSGIPPFLALALSMNEDDSVFALGGVPRQVKPSDEVAITSIIPYHGAEYIYYDIYLDDILVNGESKMKDLETGNNPWQTEAFLLDSGTTLNYLPPSIAEAVNAAFEPPAVFDEDEGLYFTKCTAQPPKLEFVIDGTRLRSTDESMMLSEVHHSFDKTLCGTTVVSNAGVRRSILGNAFFLEKLVVIDVLAMEARIAQRL